MERWYILDDALVALLQQNGFTCTKPKVQPIPGIISFYTQTREEVEAAEAASRWYETDCPIKWGERYTLPDGHVLVARGTSLELEQEIT